MTIDLTGRRGAYAFGIFMVLVLVTVFVAWIRAQDQEAIARRFLDAVRKGDDKAAAKLADIPVELCLASRCGPPMEAAIDATRGGLVLGTSWIASGWDIRCIEAKVAPRGGSSVHVYMQVELVDDTWKVTGLSTQRSSYDICDSD